MTSASHQAGTSTPIRLQKFGQAAVPALTDLLVTGDFFARVGAARAISTIGSDAEAAVPGLRQALRDSDPLIRVNMAIALGEFGPCCQRCNTVPNRSVERSRRNGSTICQ